MNARRVLNLTFFFRVCEPRVKDDSFLVDTAKKQIELVKAFGFPATWLMQYDALQKNDLVAFMKRRLDARQEVGAWLEIVQPLVEKAGFEWRQWDWRQDVGFTICYEPAER